MKAQRQALIRELVERDPITSQEQLRSVLRDRGITATQATLSRDIRDLGLIKRAADGAYRLAGAPESNGNAQAVLRRAIEEYLRHYENVEQLLVLKTDAGQAQPLALALDRARLAEIVGTIGGDDTILVICRSARDAKSVAEQLAAILESTRQSQRSGGVS